MKISTGKEALLLTGDIDHKVEGFLVKKKISASMLQIPHHGSHHSSSLNFLKKVSPKIAILSTHRTHNLLTKILQNYKANHIRVWSTKEFGQIDISFNQKRHWIKTQKESALTKWYDMN